MVSRCPEGVKAKPANRRMARSTHSAYAVAEFARIRSTCEPHDGPLESRSFGIRLRRRRAFPRVGGLDR